MASQKTRSTKTSPLSGLLLTIPQAAAQLTVSVRTLRRWIDDGRLPVVTFGRLVRLRPADLEALIAAGGFPAGSPLDNPD